MLPFYKRSDFAFLKFCTKKRLIFGFGLDRISCRESQERSRQVSAENRADAFPGTFPGDERISSAELKRDDELARLESVLFLAKEPLPSRKLALFADVSDGSRVRRLIRELNRKYAEQPCSFFVVEVAGGYQLCTRKPFAPWLMRLQEVPVEVRLSSLATETLAIIAIKQPVLRSTVESVRGVQSGEMLRQLMERNLVKIVGRSEELGRPFLYGTTKFFLQVFGLKRIEEFASAFNADGEKVKNPEFS